MLRALALKNFVIVDSLNLDFREGFSVLTGETGAGKSILLDALALVTGSRAESSVVREGESKADISAEFETSTQLDAWLAERELLGDDRKIQLRRVIEADGRSRAFINGHPTTAALLKEAGEQLLDIHGQHSAQSLLRGDGQRLLLDRFAGIEGEVKALAQFYKTWSLAEQALIEARTQARVFEQERDRLQWRLGELSALKLTPGEWATLNSEQKRLANAAQLIETTQGAAGVITQDDGAIVGQLQVIAQKLKPLVVVDQSLKATLELIESASIQLDEAGSELADYGEKIDLDPKRLSVIDERISVIFSAARKFKIAPEQLLPEQAELESQLEKLAAAQDISILQKKAAAALHHYQEAAQKVSLQRRKAATKLSQGVTKHLQSLGMQGAKLAVVLNTQEPTSYGTDSIEFQIAGHIGVAARSLAKVASGGELSRVGLAIAVLAAQANPVPTLIFDEADAGIGGSVAQVVGELMRALGDSRQVLCVTHLPQVAACAHHQFKVSKYSVKDKTISQVIALPSEDRVDEIARMLGGLEITATTRKHASELLKL